MTLLLGEEYGFKVSQNTKSVKLGNSPIGLGKYLSSLGHAGVQIFMALTTHAPPQPPIPSAPLSFSTQTWLSQSQTVLPL
jgi:hypothetical protein